MGARSPRAPVSHLLLSKVWTSAGEEQALLLTGIPTGPVRMVFISSQGESLCLSGVSPVLCSDPKDPAPGRAALHQEQLRREGEVTTWVWKEI